MIDVFSISISISISITIFAWERINVVKNLFVMFDYISRSISD